MTRYDIFNGDADGICALHQLRLASPLDSILVTGVKRDIQLLDKIDAVSGDQITVLDISLDKNRTALESLLDQGVHIEYFDHHYAGDIPDHNLLKAHIDTSPDACTSLLVDTHLNGKYRAWAVTAAFGDNLYGSACAAAEILNFAEEKLDLLKELGTLINYNGYGPEPSDLHFHPENLYRIIHRYEDPFEFIATEDSYQILQTGYKDDINHAEKINPDIDSPGHALFIFPEASWARRVSGVYSNMLTRNYPDRAHALLTGKEDGGYVVSVRAPLNNKSGADELCRLFSTGGGRKAAAGINHLEADDIERFVDEFCKAYP